MALYEAERVIPADVDDPDSYDQVDSLGVFEGDPHVIMAYILAHVTDPHVQDPPRVRLNPIQPIPITSSDAQAAQRAFVELRELWAEREKLSDRIGLALHYRKQIDPRKK